VGLASCYCRSKVHSFGQWLATNCAAPPTASAGQYTTSNCNPLLCGFLCKQKYINVRIFIVVTVMTVLAMNIRSLWKPYRRTDVHARGVRGSGIIVVLIISFDVSCTHTAVECLIVVKSRM